MTSKDHKDAAAKRAASRQDPGELRAALLVERQGYVQRGLPDRAKAVDGQLKALGATEDPKDSAGGRQSRGGRQTPPAGNPPIGKTDDGKTDDGKAQGPAPKTGAAAPPE